MGFSKGYNILFSVLLLVYIRGTCISSCENRVKSGFKKLLV